MATYTDAQVQAAWIAAGGPPQYAALMSQIAQAESGRSDVVQQGQPYATTGWGVWQITPGNSEPQVGVDNALLNLATNAQAAVAKYNAQGLEAWQGDPAYAAYIASGGKLPTPSGAGSSSSSAATFDRTEIGPLIAPPAPGMASNIGTDAFFINDAPMDISISGAIIDIELTLDATQVSVLVITLNDPIPRTALNNIALMQRSVVTIDSLMFELVAVEKQASTITVTFEPWVVVALRNAIGAVTLPPGIMTRTDFAKLLVQQVETAVFVQASDAWLYAQDDGYEHTTLEQLSRGTQQDPTEDSWTCLQRLATEIGWRCFECAGAVYFGPDGWLMTQPVSVNLAEYTNGVQSIDGTFDLGQPLVSLTFTDVSGTWAPLPGEHVTVSGVGVLSSDWLVVTLDRASVFQPDVTVTLAQPTPNLSEPSSGGAAAAVGAGFGQPGNVSSTAGSATAAQALKYAKNQLGVPYLWGGDNPQTGFDCSGLTYAAYQAAGITLERTSEDQFAEFPLLPAGGGNLRAGDLVYFGTGGDASHVGMFVSWNAGTNTATMIDAPYTGVDVRYDTFTPDIGAGWGGDDYMGANRPSP